MTIVPNIIMNFLFKLKKTTVKTLNEHSLLTKCEDLLKCTLSLLLFLNVHG